MQSPHQPNEDNWKVFLKLSVSHRSWLEENLFSDGKIRQHGDADQSKVTPQLRNMKKRGYLSNSPVNLSASLSVSL